MVWMQFGLCPMTPWKSPAARIFAEFEARNVPCVFYSTLFYYKYQSHMVERHYRLGVLLSGLSLLLLLLCPPSFFSWWALGLLPVAILSESDLHYIFITVLPSSASGAPLVCSSAWSPVWDREPCPLVSLQGPSPPSNLGRGDTP